MKGKKSGLTPASRKLNCWEYMKCGRELDGKKARELGVCPVAIDPYADGINEGINGGRICWAIVGSYSLYHQKGPCSQPHYCFECEFHKRVLMEGGIVEPGPFQGKRNTRKKKRT